MSKVTKRELRQRCIDNETAIASLESILKENGIERQPQLKQLDQSIFDGLEENWQFAAVDEGGMAYIYQSKPRVVSAYFIGGKGCDYKKIGIGYDASNWQNSLIERESRELTGSELVRAMLERGDRWVMCMVANNEANMLLATKPVIVHRCNDSGFISVSGCYSFAVAANNQGEPLTAAEAGF